MLARVAAAYAAVTLTSALAATALRPQDGYLRRRRRDPLRDFKAQFDCIKAFSETDFSKDLREIGIPVLLLHGDADQIVPIDDAARKAVKLLKQGTLKVVSGAPHGMCTTLADQINRELLAFIKT